MPWFAAVLFSVGALELAQLPNQACSRPPTAPPCHPRPEVPSHPQLCLMKSCSSRHEHSRLHEAFTCPPKTQMASSTELPVHSHPAPSHPLLVLELAVCSQPSLLRVSLSGRGCALFYLSLRFRLLYCASTWYEWKSVEGVNKWVGGWMDE